MQTAVKRHFANIVKPHEELQYLNLVKNCLDNGIATIDRTGTGTKALFGAMMRFSLRDDIFPLLTTKKTAYRSILVELLFFLRGQTDNKALTAQNVHIWTGNSTREFFDKVGIDRPEGDLGPVYGFQWRHFGAEYKGSAADYRGKGVDQLSKALQELRDKSSSRRLVVSAWNPLQLGEMALPPCHCLFQFQRSGQELNCSLYQRSADMGLGVPFNIASYALLTRIMARLAGLRAGEFVHFMGDYHVYKDHEAALREQIERKPFDFPRLRIKERDFRDFEDFEVDDFVLEGYKSHEPIKMKMSV